MLPLLLLAQVSLLTRPLYLENQPELRSAQHILIAHEDVPGVPSTVTLTKKQAEKRAKALVKELKEGADFVEIAFQNSMARSGTRGAVLGTFAPSMLPPLFDSFLFSSELGAISEPLSTRSGIHVLRRVETRAAVLQIFVEGLGEEARGRCLEILARLETGDDFGELAEEYSDDAESGSRGGQFSIFERGSNDRLLKKAAFEARVGEVVGPIESPLGLHLLKRVPLSEVDPALKESKWIRARAILVAYDTAVGADSLMQRDVMEAKQLADALFSRLREGEDFMRVASEFNDDPSGKERSGDLGWIHRENPEMAVFMERLFTKQVGDIQAPQKTTAGYVILLREK